MSRNRIFDTLLSLIDENIHLEHGEIAKKIYAKTNYCDHDYNKFLAVVSAGSLTLKDYIRKRRLYFAACELVNNPEKPLVELAQDYSYSDQSAFSRAIKKEYGKSPSVLRKSQQQIPDNRLNIENYLSKKSRLDAVLERASVDGIPDWQDSRYFENFIQATDEFGFDVSTCCLISDLSEKLDIPFGVLLDNCFDLVLNYHSDPEFLPARIDYAIDIGVTSDKELEALCKYYNCEYYELTSHHVREFQAKCQTTEGDSNGTA